MQNKRELIQQKSRLEKITGNPVTELIMTGIGIVATEGIGTSLLPLLPVLTNSLASKRMEERIANALVKINQILIDHGEKLEQITDNQYHLINKTVISILESTSEKKIAFLRDFVAGVLKHEEIPGQQALVLGRIIRDISPEEVSFILENFHYQKIQIMDSEADIASTAEVLNIQSNSNDSFIVTGLRTLGILENTQGAWTSQSSSRFSSITATLISIIKK
ncbi:MAG: hypothetical protein RL456_1664 [Pseudomonadota bacterium]|jgi:truncated hemoglobin YjbI